jgi:hypothetical protein
MREAKFNFSVQLTSEQMLKLERVASAQRRRRGDVVRLLIEEAAAELPAPEATTL